MSLQLTCPKHKPYAAIRPPRANCWYCRTLYAIAIRFIADVKKYGLAVANLD